MRKKILLSLTLLTLFFTACGGESVSTSSPQVTSEVKKDFTNVQFDNKTIPYDGNVHRLDDVQGAPEGTKITYNQRNDYEDVGTYKAEATLEKAGYNSLTLEAYLTITPIDFGDLAYENQTIFYDGKEHIHEVQLVGFLPEKTQVEEIVKDAQGNIVNSAIEVGSYDYTMKITNKNYNPLTLKASLTIMEKKKDMPVLVKNGTIYFANGLDNDYIYSLKSSEMKRLDFSKPKLIKEDNNGQVFFLANSVFNDSAKEIKDNEVNVLYSTYVISDFVKKSDTLFYFARNSFLSSTGIYQLDTSNASEEPIETMIFEGKANHLMLYGNDLYFVNGKDNNYLYKINLTSKVSSVVMKEKIHEYVISDGKLYATINGLTNDYIGYIDLTKANQTPTKLTNFAGEYLNIKDGYLYFHCTDLLQIVDPSIKGIWRIQLTNGEKEQVLQGDYVNGFDFENNQSLIYIDTSDLHLYRYNLLTKNKEDLLKDFVIPEYTPMNMGGRTIHYHNKIYYLNMYLGKTLFMYDEITKKNTQLTTNKVADLYIYEDTLIFNQVTMLVNNDVYSVNLKMGSETIKITSNDVREMVSDGTYVYGVHYNWAGTAGGISRMKLDGSDYVKFSEVNGAKNLTIRNNQLYFINCATGQDNGNIESIALKDIQNDSKKLESVNLSSKIKNVKQFIFDDNNIFYIYNGVIDNSIKRTDFTSLKEGTAIASSKTNPNEMILKGEDIYYYSYAVTATSSAGFYKVNKNATADKTQELIFGYDEKYYGSDLAISSSNQLYFLNYIPKLVLGDAHTYCLNLDTKEMKKIA